jgi:uncharacterized protein YchJ
VGAFVAAEAEMKKVEAQMTLAGGSIETNNKQQATSNNREKEQGRNELCFCGSGKKYKKCHGA